MSCQRQSEDQPLRKMEMSSVNMHWVLLLATGSSPREVRVARAGESVACSANKAGGSSFRRYRWRRLGGVDLRRARELRVRAEPMPRMPACRWHVASEVAFSLCCVACSANEIVGGSSAPRYPMAHPARALSRCLGCRPADGTSEVAAYVLSQREVGGSSAPRYP
eukprot:CAMPEP_0119405530 /NCGR_PEP_ID=MMETSP1335-20130426/64_1 /TAXON_ID=259385 /ORGANISM="Chrysoculter rhomboideus, Strain RCC1486" /LENGTH=164 /DNA_ID=CAMNT_0007429519 /DNA_START=159 /DNA_END=651 /DNA_ORIENTATION=-